MDALVADDDGADENVKYSTDTTKFANYITSSSSISSPSSNMHEPFNNILYNLPNSSPFSIVLSSTNNNHIDVTDVDDDNHQDKIISHIDNSIDDDNNDDDYGNSHTNSDKFLTSTNRSFDGDIIFVNDVNLVVAEVPDVTNMNVDEFVTNNNNTMVNGDSYNNKNNSNLRDDEGYDGGSNDDGGYRVFNDKGSGNGDMMLNENENEKNKNDKNRPIKYSNFPTQTYTNEESFNEKLNRKILFENNHKNSLHNSDDKDDAAVANAVNNEIQNDFPHLPQPEFINYGQDNVDIVKLDSDLANTNDEKTKTVYNNIVNDHDIEIHQLSENENEITKYKDHKGTITKMSKYNTNDIETVSNNKETGLPSLQLQPPPPIQSTASSSASTTTNNEPQRLLVNITIGTDSGIGSERHQIYVLQVAVPGGPNFHPLTPTYHDSHDSQNSLNCPPVLPPAPPCPCPCSCLDNSDGELNEMNYFPKNNTDGDDDDNSNNNNDYNSKYSMENDTVPTAMSTANDGDVGVNDESEANGNDFVSTTTEWMIDRSGAMIGINEKLCPDATPILILEGEDDVNDLNKIYLNFVLYFNLFKVFLGILIFIF